MHECISNLIKKFYTFEIEQKLLSSTENSKWWIGIRYDVCMELIKQLHGPFNSVVPNKKLNSLGNNFNNLINNISLEKLDGCYDIIVINPDRYSEYKKKKVNIVTYPLIEMLSNSYKVLSVNQRKIRYNNYPCKLITRNYKDSIYSFIFKYLVFIGNLLQFNRIKDFIFTKESTKLASCVVNRFSHQGFKLQQLSLRNQQELTVF